MASWSSHGEQGCAVGKTDDLIAARRQDHGKRVANGGIVVDYENLPAEKVFSACFIVHTW